MKFVEPIWLLFGLIACAVLLWRHRRIDRLQSSLLSAFVAPHLAERLTRSLSPGRRRLKRLLFLAGVASLFIALARPQAGFRWAETHRKGLELLFAVDTSKSMLAEDVKPNRLTRAKLAVEDMLGKLDGDGVGLVAFSGGAFLQCPVTLDYDAFRDSVAALDTHIIPRGGTDISAAIHEAESAFATRPNSDKILILMTDGENLEGGAVAAAKAAARDGVKIFTIGVGSANGELIPVQNDNGETEFLRDANGQFVRSRLDESTLQELAAVTGGLYQPLGQHGEGLMKVYDEGLKPFIRHDLASRQHKVYIERFEWPLLAGLGLLFIEPLIGTRRRTGAAHTRTHSVAELGGFRSHPAATLGLIGALLILPGLSRASTGSAEKAYHKGDYQAAAAAYADSLKKEPDNAQLQFNTGAAAYKAGEFDSAQAAFEHALSTTELPVQQNAYYNLGNAQYRLGQNAESTHPEETIKSWEAAVKSYEASLQLKPDDADARYNRDLVKRKLDELKQQQQQQQKENQDQQANNGSGQDQNDQADQQQTSSQNQQADNSSGSDQQAQSRDQTQGQPQDQQAGQNEPSPGQEPGSTADLNQEEQSGQTPQQANMDEQEQPAGGTPEAQKVSDQQGSESLAQTGERRAPGQMTTEEAKRLLDSLKGDDQSVAAAQLSRGQLPPQNDQPLKDW